MCLLNKRLHYRGNDSYWSLVNWERPTDEVIDELVLYGHVLCNCPRVLKVNVNDVFFLIEMVDPFHICHQYKLRDLESYIYDT